ncbi:MAG: hypothetical protein FJZ43_01070 [Candidatus Staskawiczbacteria bacterium]|nr:hypothetical protein [Candidatus Staskawiczbacteria bacterium]
MRVADRMRTEEDFTPYKGGPILCTCGLESTKFNEEIGHGACGWKPKYYRCKNCNTLLVFSIGDGIESPRLIGGEEKERK